jgi:hypothetical protein
MGTPLIFGLVSKYTTMPAILSLGVGKFHKGGKPDIDPLFVFCISESIIRRSLERITELVCRFISPDGRLIFCLAARLVFKTNTIKNKKTIFLFKLM